MRSVPFRHLFEQCHLLYAFLFTISQARREAAEKRAEQKGKPDYYLRPDSTTPAFWHDQTPGELQKRFPEESFPSGVQGPIRISGRKEPVPEEWKKGRGLFPIPKDADPERNAQMAKLEAEHRARAEALLAEAKEYEEIERALRKKS